MGEERFIGVMVGGLKSTMVEKTWWYELVSGHERGREADRERGGGGDGEIQGEGKRRGRRRGGGEGRGDERPLTSGLFLWEQSFFCLWCLLLLRVEKEEKSL